jgi:type IV fimbrial biogenesis protein FimT
VGRDVGELLGHQEGRDLRVSALRAGGFTLIELMVSLTIAAILLVLAAPLYSEWVADNQISNGAQLVADGLRTAQGEAIKRNTQVQLVLDKTAGTGGWVVQIECDGTALQRAYFSQGAEKALFAVTPAAATTVTFTGLGQIGTLKCDGTALPPPFTDVDVTSAMSGTRPLRVTVGGGRTGIKLCDPNLTSPDPQACP